MRALVVGLGHMGRFHAKALTDLGHRVITVDPDPQAGADHLTTPRRRFAIVCISTPIPHLAEQAAQWAGHEGHLLIEKPMCATHTEARELTALLEHQRVAVGYVERFNPNIRAAHIQPGTPATFTRWNDRPSTDPALDLLTHDLDLCQHLHLTPLRFDTRHSMPIKQRKIILKTVEGQHTIDLLDHRESPLHTQWQTFLKDQPGPATPEDATRVLHQLAIPQAA